MISCARSVECTFKDSCRRDATLDWLSSASCYSFLEHSF